jgi:hypothetical protein
MHPRFLSPLVWVTPVLLYCSACSDDSVAVGAVAPDTVASKSDTAIAADVAAGPSATIAGEPHKADPYVEISGKWDGASKHVLLTVWIGGVKDLLGIAAHLQYDPTALQLVNGEVLAVAQGSSTPGSYKTRSVYNAAMPGRVLLGSARFSANPLPFALPTGAAITREAWVTLEFIPIAAGKTAISFDPHSTLLRAADGTEVTAEWHGASIDVPAAVVSASVGVP